MNVIERAGAAFVVVAWVTVVTAQEPVGAGEQSAEMRPEEIAELREQLAEQLVRADAVLCLGRANEQGVAE